MRPTSNNSTNKPQPQLPGLLLFRQFNDGGLMVSLAHDASVRNTYVVSKVGAFSLQHYCQGHFDAKQVVFAKRY
jgi:hypothetical protein